MHILGVGENVIYIKISLSEYSASLSELQMLRNVPSAQLSMTTARLHTLSGRHFVCTNRILPWRSSTRNTKMAKEIQEHLINNVIYVAESTFFLIYIATTKHKYAIMISYSWYSNSNANHVKSEALRNYRYVMNNGSHGKSKASIGFIVFRIVSNNWIYKSLHQAKSPKYVTQENCPIFFN